MAYACTFDEIIASVIIGAGLQLVDDDWVS